MGQRLDGDLKAYLDFYNRERPHQALGYQIPGQVFEEGRPDRRLPDRAEALSFSEVVSDIPAGDSLKLGSIVVRITGTTAPTPHTACPVGALHLPSRLRSPVVSSIDRLNR